MGSAAKTFDALPSPVRQINNLFNPATIIARGAAGLDTMKRAPREAADRLDASMKEQQAKAAALQQQIESQPKVVRPDDFLARKNKALQSMRLGLASTMSPTGFKSPSLGAPSLGGKTALGQ